MNMQHTMIFRPSLQSSTPSEVDPFELDVIDDLQLDELAYGVICLDRQGTILRYNLAEAKFARLDRTTVIGKGFFTEVAPCTATPEFKGRFDQYVELEEPTQALSFHYLFDFKFGAQEVDVELVPAKSKGRYYLLINRQKLLEPRLGLPKGFAAPLHKELVSPEKELGLVRDRWEQRGLRLPLPAISALMKTCDEIAPETWGLLSGQWGHYFGRHTAIDLEIECLDRQGKSLDSVSMEQACELIASIFSEQGWGRIQFDLGYAPRGAIAITLYNSVFAATRRTSLQPRSQMISGILSALLTHIANKRLFVTQTRCASSGDEACEFLVVGEAMHDRLSGLDLLHTLGNDAALTQLEQDRES